MKRSKAFILVEILTGMALQAGFIFVLCTSFYLMLSFYTRTQQYLNARQKGEKVIAYVDSRIRNVGLGLHECGSSSEVRDALTRLNSAMLDNKSLTLPVAVTENNWNFKAKDNTDNKFKGNRLILLYTQRPSDLNLMIRTPEYTPPADAENTDEEDGDGVNQADNNISGRHYSVVLSSDAYNSDTYVNVGFISGSNNQYSSSEFNQNNISNSQRRGHLTSYTVMSGTGRPLYIGTMNADNTLNLYLFTASTATTRYVRVCPGDELLYLKCERMFVDGQNFKFWKFQSDSWGTSSDAISNELGILELYFELDTVNNILDMYVLVNGGFNDSGDTRKPDIWPQKFWKSDFANYTVYVSRASWKLSNINFSGASWN